MALYVVLNHELQRNAMLPLNLNPVALAQRVAPKKSKWEVDPAYTFLYATLPAGTERFHCGYLDLVSFAYSNHEKLRVTPHDLWFIVLTELAKYVNKNSEQCRELFTAAGSEKTEIVVFTNDPGTINPLALIQELTARVPTNIDAFIPSLSTMDENVYIAFCAAFADAVQSYYSYSTMLCGIPEIEVTGTFEDWYRCVDSIKALGAIFLQINAEQVVRYLITVGDIFAKIAYDVAGDGDSYESPNTAFWKDIFTSKNIGSGNDLVISGWIKDLFLYQPSLAKLENFSSAYATFPYKNLDTGRQFRAAYGAFSQLRSSCDFIYSGYGSVIHERI